MAQLPKWLPAVPEIVNVEVPVLSATVVDHP